MAHMVDRLSVTELDRRARTVGEAGAAREDQAIWRLAPSRLHSTGIATSV